MIGMPTILTATHRIIALGASIIQGVIKGGQGSLRLNVRELIGAKEADRDSSSARGLCTRWYVGVLVSQHLTIMRVLLAAGAT